MKKVILGFILLTGLLMGPGLASALSPNPTADEIRIEIARLQALIVELTAKLNLTQPILWCHAFNSNLGVGSSGTDVTALQTALQKEGVYTGAITSRYAEDTASAVSAFQLKYKANILTPAGLVNPTGYFGPSSRRQLNVLYFCGNRPGNLPPVISGISGPTTLRVGEQGTWSVRASDPENASLSYSIDWGDRSGVGSNANFPADIPTSRINQTGVFSHSYSTVGIHNPTFIVSDTSGHSARTSLSVTVGQTNTQENITVLSPNGGETWVANSVQAIRWGIRTNSNISKVDLYLQPAMPDCPPGLGCIQVMPQPIVLDKNIQANLTYNWIVATDIVNNYISAGNYWLYVCPTGSESNYDSACDESDRTFSII